MGPYFILGRFDVHCCPRLAIESSAEGDGTTSNVRKAHPRVFTTYEMEPGMVNDRHHYTSMEGEFALAYNPENAAWWIQLERDRGDLRGLAFVNSSATCVHDTRGQEWMYAEGSWVPSGPGDIIVRCVSSFHNDV